MLKTIRISQQPPVMNIAKRSLPEGAIFPAVTIASAAEML
jgi:hypothetical protein